MSQPAISATGVVFRFGDHTALAASDFEIPFAAITAVIGPNGSGKSTVLNGISGLIEPVSGSLEVTAPDGRRPRIAYVVQSTKVNDALPVTAREVVAMGRFAGAFRNRRLTHEDRDAITRAMRRMDILHLQSRHLSELSGGERQRVFVAQGLAQDHDILLLDEPITGLDLLSAEAIDAVIHDEAERGCTVVMTTHDLAEARVADHALLLSGRVIAWGDPQSVLTVENLAAAYGPNLLHLDGERLFLDDPHHHPADVAHRHERSIHVESSAADAHPPPPH